MDLKRFIYAGFGLVCLWLITGCGSHSLAYDIPDLSDAAGRRTHLLFYMVGSDLEDDIKPRDGEPDEETLQGLSTQGLGTNDLKELIAGYQALSPRGQDNIALWVAFGGARKQGWQGVKYADMPCLIEDAKDDYFGNADCYAFQNEAANMGDAETLAAFLGFSKPQMPQTDKRLLIFWNHGTAYRGFGHDLNHNQDSLRLPELKQALTSADFHSDLIGFDACLMANLEVANQLHTFGDYLVASEHLEPGHGWDHYTLIQYLGKTPAATPVDIAKKIVDAYMTQPAHQHTTNKTLSVLQLDQVTPLINAFHDVLPEIAADSFQALVNAVRRAPKFGTEVKSRVSYGIDLKGWVEHLDAELEQSDMLSFIGPQIDKLIVYQRHDGSSPGAHGVSMYSLNKALQSVYPATISLSPRWSEFVQTYFDYGLDDHQAPTIGKPSACTHQNQTGQCFQVKDNIALRYIRQMQALPEAGGTELIISSRPLFAINGRSRYFLPDWNGEWPVLCFPDCLSGNQEPASLHFKRSTENGNTIYATEGRYNGEEAEFLVEQLPTGEMIDSWVVPYELNANGNPVLSRRQIRPQAGARLQLGYLTFTSTNERRWRLGPEYTLTGPLVWGQNRLSSEAYQFIHAEDLKGNSTHSAPISIQP